jgi:hypothetical protein
MAKNRQIGGVSTFCENLRAKTNRNTFFCTSEAKKTTVFTKLFALVAKTHAIYSVFWQVPSKNAGMYAVFSMLQEVVFSMSKRQDATGQLSQRQSKNRFF